VVPVMGRVTINGTLSQFSCKKTIPLGIIRGHQDSITTREAQKLQSRKTND